jgi:L-aspartate oxidase
MSRHVAVLRDAGSLAAASGALGSLTASLDETATPNRASWEATNLLLVAAAVVAAASVRTESRGCHRRTDFPDPVESWRRSLDVRLDAVGTLHVDA